MRSLALQISGNWIVAWLRDATECRTLLIVCGLTTGFWGAVDSSIAIEYDLNGPVLAGVEALPPALETQTGRGISVSERPHPDYDPIPLSLGNGSGGPLDGLVLFSSFGIEQLYDSNIYRTANSHNSDLITVANPALSVRTDQENHHLEFTVDSQFGTHWKTSREDYQDHHLSADGRLDVERGTFLVAGAHVDRLHDDRSSPDDSGGLRPTTYLNMGGDLGGRLGLGPLGLRFLGSVKSLSYDNNITSTGPLDNRQRNHNEYDGGGRLEYQYLPNTNAFAFVMFNRRSYQQVRDDLGYARGSVGGQAALGAELDLGGLVTGEVFAGYTWQNYDDSRLQPVKAPLFGGSLVWNLTPLTSIRLTLKRTVEETDLDPASGALTSLGSLAIDHELLRNLIITLDGSAAVTDYIGTSRTDKMREAGIHGRYLIDRGLYFNSGITYKDRRSNAVGGDFEAAIVQAGITANF